METSKLLDVIEAYCGNDEDSGAVMITGSWGSGKTHFIENDLRGRLEKTSKKKIIRLSLFGIQSSSEFYDRLSGIILSGKKPSENWNAEWEAAAETISQTTKNVVSGMAEKFLGISLSVDNETIAPLLMGDAVVVFDDFERCKIDFTTMLGIMNQIVENQGNKLLILCDEERIVSRLSNNNEQSSKEEAKAACNEYVEMKEKVVWNTYEYVPDIQTIAPALLKDSCTKLTGQFDWEQALTYGLQKACCLNLRTVKRLMPFAKELAAMDFFYANIVDECQKADVFADLIELGSLLLSGYRFETVEGSDIFDFTKIRRSGVRTSLWFAEHILDGSRLDVPQEILYLYVEANYPLGAEQRRINKLIDEKIYFDYDDDEASAILSDLYNAARQNNISMAKIFQALQLAFYLESAGIRPEQCDGSSFIDLLKKEIDHLSEQEACKEALGHQAELYYPDMFSENQKLHDLAVDLHSYLLHVAEDMQQESLLNDQTSDTIDEFLEAIKKSHRGALINTPALDIEALVLQMDIRQLQKFQSAITKPFQYESYDKDAEGLKAIEWLTDLRNRLSEIEAGKMARFRIERIVHELEALIEQSQ